MQNPYLPMRAVVRDIKKETADIRTFAIELIDLEGKFSFEPGQFNQLSVMGIGEMPVSIGSILEDGRTITHTVRIIGRVTSRLFEMGVGGIIGMRGPFGHGWPLYAAEGRDFVLATGGLGLAPLRALIDLIEKDRKKFGRVNLAYGARTPNDMIFTDLFDRWRSIPDFELFLTVDQVPPGTVWEHSIGVVTGLFDRLTVDPSRSLAFTCGPEIMMKFVTQSLLIRGFAEDSIFVSMERRMRCAMGKCGHCMIGPRYVCTDGPVFPYTAVGWLPHNVIAGKGLAAA